MTKRIRSSDYLEKQRQYRKRTREDRRIQVLIFLGNKCNLCGSQENLEIDHIDPTTKSFSVSSATPNDFWSEIRKCQLLCKSCHLCKSIKQISGSKCHSAKLNEDQIKEIRSNKQLKNTELSKKYGVSPMQISRIKKNQRWKHVN